VRGNRLEEIGTRLTTLDIDIKERRDNLEATNLQEVISSTAAKLLQLDAAQASYARINQQTLFDLIK
jgi:flagellar hook-associated protein 3 FlgL